MNQHELLKILTPPPDPVAIGSVSGWRAVEDRIGLALPSDYKWFISVYGAGIVEAAELVVFSPFAADDLTSLDSWISYHRSYEIEMQDYGFDVPPPGLLPWAKDSTRGTCLWDTKSGDPEIWGVFVLLQEIMEVYPDNMTTFLYKLLTGARESIVYRAPLDPRLPTRYRPVSQ